MSGIDAQTEETARRRLGIRLREARLYLGLSTDEVANYLKIEPGHLMAVETGKEQVTPFELNRLGRFYRQPIATLTDEADANLNLPPDVAHLARQTASLSNEDRFELVRFAEYLISIKGQGQGTHGK